MYFRTFQRFKVYALFFVCLRAQDRARKKIVISLFSEITSSLGLVTLAMEVHTSRLYFNAAGKRIFSHAR